MGSTWTHNTSELICAHSSQENSPLGSINAYWGVGDRVLECLYPLNFSTTDILRLGILILMTSNSHLAWNAISMRCWRLQASFSSYALECGVDQVNPAHVLPESRCLNLSTPSRTARSSGGGYCHYVMIRIPSAVERWSSVHSMSL